ncbi:MAG: NAD-dependent epimerase/dehydratase family protein [Ilumatobacteraceae bacterium]
MEPVDRPPCGAVMLTGADGTLGRRVADLLRQSGRRVVVAGGPDSDAGVEAGGDLAENPTAGDPVAVVVDLGSSDYDRRAARRESATESAAATLAAADRADASHVVFVSSALVYGAMTNNPVPLTEDATLRPDVEFVFARQLASAEELVEQWRLSGAGRSTSVLRPAVALSAGGSSRLASALVSGFGRRLAEDDPPSQFLHLDDLAAAIELAVVDRLDGVYNVAPDGWVPGDRVRALSGERPRLPLPERLGEFVAGLRWRLQRGPIPPGLLSYTLEPWVVSNGRLREAGWTPTVTNEQTYVEGTEAPWWTVVSPKRRQELALGGGLAAVGVLVAIAVWLGRRRLTRRRG